MTGILAANCLYSCASWSSDDVCAWHLARQICQAPRKMPTEVASAVAAVIRSCISTPPCSTSSERYLPGHRLQDFLSLLTSVLHDPVEKIHCPSPHTVTVAVEIDYEIHNPVVQVPVICFAQPELSPIQVACSSCHYGQSKSHGKSHRRVATQKTAESR